MTVPTDCTAPGRRRQSADVLQRQPEQGRTDVQNYNTLSDKYGEEYEHWNGVDVSVNGRLQNGLRFQAGTSTGRTVVGQLRRHRAAA